MAFRKSKPAPQAVPTPPAGITARVFTPNFVLHGRLQPSGAAFLGWLNNVNQRTITLTDVRVTALAPNGAVSSLAQSEATLPKTSIVAIDLLEEQGQRRVQLPTQQAGALFYTERFVVRGQMYMAGDMPLRNAFNVLSGDFFPVGQAEMHPLVATRDWGERRASLLLLNRPQVDFYHPLA